MHGVSMVSQWCLNCEKVLYLYSIDSIPNTVPQRDSENFGIAFAKTNIRSVTIILLNDSTLELNNTLRRSHVPSTIFTFRMTNIQLMFATISTADVGSIYPTSKCTGPIQTSNTGIQSNIQVRNTFKYLQRYLQR